MLCKEMKSYYILPFVLLYCLPVSAAYSAQHSMWHSAAKKPHIEFYSTKPPVPMSYDWTWFHRFKYPLYFCGALTALCASRWFYNYYFYKKKPNEVAHTPGVLRAYSPLGTGDASGASVSTAPSAVTPTAPFTSEQPSLTSSSTPPASVPVQLASRPSSPPTAELRPTSPPPPDQEAIVVVEGRSSPSPNPEVAKPLSTPISPLAGPRSLSSSASISALSEEDEVARRQREEYEQWGQREGAREKRRINAAEYNKNALQRVPFVTKEGDESLRSHPFFSFQQYGTAELVLHMCRIFRFDTLKYHDDACGHRAYDDRSRVTVSEPEKRRNLRNFLQGEPESELGLTIHSFTKWLHEIYNLDRSAIIWKHELSPIQLYTNMIDVWKREYKEVDAKFAQALQAKAHFILLKSAKASALAVPEDLKNEFLVIEFQEQVFNEIWSESASIDDNSLMPAQLSHYSLVSVITRTRFQDKNTSAIDAFQMACLDQGRMHFWERVRPELTQVRGGECAISETPAEALREAIGKGHKSYRVVGLIYKKNPSG